MDINQKSRQYLDKFHSISAMNGNNAQEQFFSDQIKSAEVSGALHGKENEPAANSPAFFEEKTARIFTAKFNKELGKGNMLINELVHRMAHQVGKDKGAVPAPGIGTETVLFTHRKKYA